MEAGRRRELPHDAKRALAQAAVLDFRAGRFLSHRRHPAHLVSPHKVAFLGDFWSVGLSVPHARSDGALVGTLAGKAGQGPARPPESLPRHDSEDALDQNATHK